MRKNLLPLLIAAMTVVSPVLKAERPLSYRQLDDILSGMNGEMPKVATQSCDLDAVMGAMGEKLDLEAVSRSMDSGRRALYGVAEAMAIDKTLDYITNAYADQNRRFAVWNGDRRFSRPSSFMSRSVLPVTGTITSRYGFRPKYNRMHKGIDIALNIGDTIRAAMAGTISRVDNDPKGYGIFVVMRHDGGMETRYAHLSRTLVWPGTRVMAGEPIALGGSTGNSTGPHLHFETRVANQAIDPSTMFDFSRPSMMAFSAEDDPETESRSVYTYDPANTQAPYSLASIAKKSTSTTAEKSTYIVRVGDTLASVARSTGVSVYKLCSLNMLSTTDALEPGRMLRLR